LLISAPQYYTCGGGARRSFKRPLAEQIGAKLAALGKFDDFVGEDSDNRVGSILKTQRRPRHFECDAHHAPGLRLEYLPVQVWRDGHGMLAIRRSLEVNHSRRAQIQPLLW
jgi:hypothetical protein